MSVNNEEYAVALTDKVVIRKPELSLKYSKILAFKYKRIANTYNNLFFKSAKERLIIFFNERGHTDGILEGNQIKLKNYLTKNGLAKIICTTRQTCSSLINELVKEEKIHYDRKEIILYLDKLNNAE